ncbi:MAG: 50S ribosomal protein L24 [bacterium]|nr:50S ribosomal protein L24 [bacterium]
MKVKVGDTVKIIAGKDKGKEGKVIKTYKKLDKVVVEGLNIVKKHSKPRTNQDKGGIFDVEAPIHISNVKVISNTKEDKAKVKEVKNSEEKVTKKNTSKKKETK